MRPPTPPRVTRFLVWVAARMVPRCRRLRFQREWEAELTAETGRRSTGSMIVSTFGAFPFSAPDFTGQ